MRLADVLQEFVNGDRPFNRAGVDFAAGSSYKLLDLEVMWEPFPWTD
jgi:hypothetical protein